MNKKIKVTIISVLIGTSLLGGYEVKKYNDKATEQKRIAIELQQKEQNEKELQELRDREEAQSKQKAEEEAKAKAYEEAKLKAEQEAKADEEAKAKAQQEPPKPTANTSEPSSQKPATTTTTTGKTHPALPAKYDVAYWTQVENDIVTLCNQERAKAGAGALSNNESLRQIARYKSDEMLQYNYFDHPSPITGFQPWDLASSFGWHSSIFGENIWMTKMDGLNPSDKSEVTYYNSALTAQNIVSNWMNSPGHRANILNKNFTKIGVGLAYSLSGRSYATQEFSN